MNDAYVLSSRAGGSTASLGRSLADVLTVARNVSPPPSLFGVPDRGPSQVPAAAAAARLLRAVYPDDVCGFRVAIAGDVPITTLLGTASAEAALNLSVALTAASRGGDVTGTTSVAVPVGGAAAVGVHRPGGGLTAGDLVVVQTLAWLCSEAANRPR